VEQPEKEAEPESEAEVVKEELRELLTVKLPERLLDTETVLEPLLREEAEGDRVPLMLPEGDQLLMFTVGDREPVTVMELERELLQEPL